MTSGDTVALWDVPLSDGMHRVEFEHGTTTGKRVIRVDGRELLRKDWMFKLVGRESFQILKANCVIIIEALGSFAYQYTLEVNGKSFQKFTENQSKVLQMWTTTLGGVPTRICMEKDTLNVFVNGQKVDTAGEFVEDGTETHFESGPHVCYIKSQSSGKRKKGMIHQLFIDDREIPLADIDA